MSVFLFVTENITLLLRGMIALFIFTAVDFCTLISNVWVMEAVNEHHIFSEEHSADQKGKFPSQHMSRAKNEQILKMNFHYNSKVRRCFLEGTTRIYRSHGLAQLRLIQAADPHHIDPSLGPH